MVLVDKKKNISIILSNNSWFISYITRNSDKPRCLWTISSVFKRNNNEDNDHILLYVHCTAVLAFELMDLSPWVQMLILTLRQKHTAYSDTRAHYKSRKKFQSFIRHCEPDRSFLQAIGQVWRRTDISPSLTHSLQRQRLSLVTHGGSDSGSAAWCHPVLPSAVVGQTVFYPITAITTQRREHIIYNVYYNDINILRA